MSVGLPQPERDTFRHDIENLHSLAIGYLAVCESVRITEPANGLFQHTSAITSSGLKIDLTTSTAPNSDYYLLRIIGPREPSAGNTESELRATWSHNTPNKGVIKKRMYGVDGERKEKAMLLYIDMITAVAKLNKLIAEDTPVSSAHEL